MTSQARMQYAQLDEAIRLLTEEAQRMDEPEPEALQLGADWVDSDTDDYLAMGPVGIPALYARLRRFWHAYRSAWLKVIDYHVPTVYLVPPADIEPSVKSLWDASWDHASSDAGDAIADVEKGIEEVYDQAREAGSDALDVIETVAEPVIEVWTTASVIALSVVGIGGALYLASWLPRRR